MKRKVCQVGPATLMVSLPSKWARENGVKKGDELEITPDGGKLCFSKDSISKNIRKDVFLNNSNYHLVTYAIRIPYSEGYDEIKIFFNEPNVIDVIRKVNQDNFIGFEVVEQTEKYCILKNIVSPQDEEYLSLYNRLLSIVLDFKNMVYSYITSKKYGREEEIKCFEFAGDKINYWCRRVLNVRPGLYDEINRKRIYKILGILEEIMDEYRKLYVHVVKNRIPSLSNPTKSYFLHVNSLLDYIVFLLRNKERQTKHLVELRDKFGELIDNETFKRIPVSEVSLLIFLRGAVDLIIHIGCEEISYS